MRKRICSVTCNIRGDAGLLSSSQPQQDNVFPLSGFTGSSLVALARLDSFPAITERLVDLQLEFQSVSGGGSQSVNNLAASVSTPVSLNLA